MRKTFRGLCIGGPHDGKMIEESVPFHRAIARIPIPISSFLNNDPGSVVDAPYVDYVFERLRSAPTKDDPGGEFGLWRRTDQNMTDMMAQLITGYHPAIVDRS